MKDLISNYRVKPSQELVGQLKSKNEAKCDKMDLVTRPTSNPKVGRYLRDSIIRAPVRGESVNEFYFLQKIISQEQINLLKFATAERYSTGALIYECSLYSMQLGDVKIYYNHFKNQICRCKILNMHNKLFGEHLETKVDILLIDEGIKRRNISLSRIFEVPTQVKDIMEVSPGANLARLKLDPPLPIEYQDYEVDNYFMLQLQKTKIANVKVLDFVEGYYVVDMIDHRGFSLVDHINKRFNQKFEEFSRNHKNEQLKMNNCYEYVFPIDPFILAKHHRKPLQPQSIVDGFRAYQGALRYFQQKERDIFRSSQQLTTYSMLEQLHKVRVIFWGTDDTLYIIPNDTHYTDIFPWFKKQIARFQEYLLAKEQDENHSYEVGDWCLFKNDKDPNLGPWLRGIVVKRPATTHGILDKELTDRSRKKSADAPRSNSPTLTSERAAFVYHIKSVDFGFQCVRGADGLIPIPEHNQLLKMPTWSMRCKLFGIYPFNLENSPVETLELSKHCILRIGSWMFERITNDEKYSNFYLLFRCRLQDYKTYYPDPEFKAAITLFHKQVFRSSLNDCFKSKKRIPELDCLNYDLIQEGRADSSSSGTSLSSNVDLDHHIINTLIVHKFSR